MTDCPICMESIETGKNCLTTECGHSFHTSCLMKSVAHNGFGCPYCRTAMTEDHEEEEEDSSVYTDESDEEYEFEEDDLLRGFRFFFNRINNYENDAEDIEEEDDYMFYTVFENQDVIPPSAECIVNELQEQGITYEQVVNTILYQGNLRGFDTEVNRETNHTIWRIIREISFRPDQEQEQEEEQPTQVVDFEAQRKTSQLQLKSSQEEYII